MTSALTAGMHAIRAVYGGNALNTPADSPSLGQGIGAVSPQLPGMGIVSNENPSAQGASVTLTAIVTGFVPSGTVQFRSNNVVIPGCNAVAFGPPNGASTRTATCTTTSLAVGTNTIVALYSGDVLNQPGGVVMPQGVFGPNACAQFNDVASSSGFCANVQWLVNRAITLGCGLVDYCPGQNVIRLAMAAFMNREGVALTTDVLPSAAANGAMSLPSPTLACVTSSYEAGDFPRRALARAFANLYSPTGGLDATVDLVYSTNGGATWTSVPNALGHVTLYTASDDKTLNLFGALDLAVGSTYQSALRVQRAAGTGNASIYCNNRVQIRNRNGSSPPF
jgi:hypothetical protein